MFTLTRDAVARVTRALITLNRSTTSLDVKVALRRLGFYATQDEVRSFLLDVQSANGDLTYDDSNGNYRVYTFTTPFPDAANDLDTSSFVATPSLGKTVQNKLQSFLNTTFGKHKHTSTPATSIASSVNDTINAVTDAFLHRDDRPTTYLVTDTYGGNARTYDNVTRAQAKYLWSNATGFRYASARTTKQ